MMIYDVIVVGSGPAGATAAATLALNKRAVLLVDRHVFPRDKVCGDGMPTSVMNLVKSLGIDVHRAGLKFLPIYGVTMTAPSRRSLVHSEKSSSAFAVTSPRFDFDVILHERALQLGAHFEVMDVQAPLLTTDARGLQHVRGVVERRGQRLIEHEARVVIAADGASSAIARALYGRVSEVKHTAIAIRAYGCVHAPLPAYVHFDFDPSLLPGYAWVFPISSDRVNLGVGLFDQSVYRRGGNNLKQLLKKFSEVWEHKYGIAIEPGTVKAWPLPVWSSNASRVSKGAFLTGDAGRFVDPLTGGGIYPAMQTGQLAGLAAARILDGSETAYAEFDTACRQKIGKPLRRAQLVQKFIGSRPRVFDAIFAIAYAAPWLRSGLLDALAGEHS